MIMHWGNRRRRNTQNVKDFSHEALKKHATKLLNNRWQLLAPPPLDTNAMWDSLLTAEQHRAFTLIENTLPTALSKGTQLFMKFDIPLVFEAPLAGTRFKPDMLELTLPESRPIPDTNLRFSNGHPLYVSQLPREMRETLCEWVPKWLQAQGETYQVLAKLDELFKVCNTIGHIKRVWPNVATLLPERAQLKLAEAKVKSPYPPGALDTWYEENGTQKSKLKDEWKPEALAWYDERLTEAMCLPLEFEYDEGQRWSIEITKVPA